VWLLGLLGECRRDPQKLSNPAALSSLQEGNDFVASTKRFLNRETGIVMMTISLVAVTTVVVVVTIHVVVTIQFVTIKILVF